MGRTNKGGYYASRKKEWPRRFFSVPRWFWFLALVVVLWIVGVTQAWPQSSGSSSNSSGSDLTTWERLSEEYRKALREQSTRLLQALTEMETSKASSEKLTLLLEESLKANERLKNYNSQIASRMQERDEDLAASYGEIERLLKQRLKLIFIIAALGVVLAGGIALKIILRK